MEARTATDVTRSALNAKELLSTLIKASDAELTSLLEARPDLVKPALQGLGSLAAAVASPESLRAYHEGADEGARQALEALCLVADPVSPAVLASLLGCGPDQVSGVLARLRRAWVVVGPEGKLVRNAGLFQAFPKPAGLGPPLRTALQGFRVSDLADVSKRLDLSVRALKSTLVEAVAVALSTPSTVDEVLNAGPPGARELAQRMAQAPGPRHLADADYANFYNARRSPNTPIGWLVSHALLVPESGWWALQMPAEVAIILRGGRLFDEPFFPEPPALKARLVGEAALDNQAAGTVLGVVADVAKLLEAWGTEPPGLLQSGGLGVKELRRVAKLVGRSERDAARLLELMVRAGLIGRELSDGVVLPTKDYDRWVGQPPHARAARLAAAVMSSPSWLSVAGSTDEKGKPVPALLDQTWLASVANARPRRGAVVSLLSTLAPGEGCDTASLARRAVWEHPALWQAGPASPTELVSWALAEAVLVGLVATDPRGGSETEGSGHELVGLTSFGRSAQIDAVSGWADEDAVAAALARFCPPPCTEVVLQADLTAVAAGELPLQLKRELDLLAEVESTGAATVYRFSEASLRRGFDLGRTAEDILAVLSRYAPKGVPQPLRYLVEDLGRRFGQVRVGFATSYVRSDDPALLVSVVRAKKLARMGLRLLAPTVAVSSEEPVILLRALRDAGYLAAAEGPDGAVLALGVRKPRRLPGRSSPKAPSELLPPSVLRLVGRSGEDHAGSGRATAGSSALGPASAGPAVAEAAAAAVAQLRHPAPSSDPGGQGARGQGLGGKGPGGKGAREAAGGRRGSGGAVPDVRGKLVAGGSEVPRLSLLAGGGGSGAGAGGRTGGRGAEHAGARAGAGVGERSGERAGAGVGERGGEYLGDHLASAERRPSHIAKGDEAVEALLKAAFDNAWLVRLSCERAGGSSWEMVGEVLNFEEEVAYILCFDTGDFVELEVAEVRWARVMTEVEEDRYMGTFEAP